MGDTYFIAALQGCGVVVVAVVFFLFFILSNKFLSAHLIRYFVAAALATALLAVADCVQCYYATLPYPTAMRMFCASAGYSLRVVVLYFVLMLLFRDGSMRRRNFFRVLMYLNVAVSFSAFFTDKVFYFTAANQLVRGPLISVPFIISAIYFAVLITYGFRSSNQGDQRELILVLIVFVLATVSTLLEVLLETRGLLTNVIILSIVFYYMNFLTFNYSRDRLTGAYLRNKLYDDTNAARSDYGVITMDMNDLKKINDTRGHQAGDKALKGMAKTVLEYLPTEAKFYRIGGDEFAVIYRTDEAEKVEELADCIRSTTAAGGFPVAVGWDMRQGGEPFEKAMARADALMYTDKAALKSAD